MGYQKPRVHLWSKLQVIRCYLRDMPLLKTIYKIHLFIQAEKFLEIKDVWFIVLELEQPFHLAASKRSMFNKTDQKLTLEDFFSCFWYNTTHIIFIQIYSNNSIYNYNLIYTFTQLSKHTCIRICWICF